MHVFSHSSKTDGGNDGLEFLSTRNDHVKLQKMGPFLMMKYHNWKS